MSRFFERDIGKHLLGAGEKLLEKRFDVDIEIYMAKMENERVTFERIDQHRE